MICSHVVEISFSLLQQPVSVFCVLASRSDSFFSVFVKTSCVVTDLLFPVSLGLGLLQIYIWICS